MAELSDIPDVTDPDVRAMVLRNHEPEEAWTYGGRVDVHCAACCKPWPCPSRQAAWEAEKEAIRQSVLRIERPDPGRPERLRRRRWWF
jgi:hypothetical protein